jgi:hypothetical protein
MKIAHLILAHNNPLQLARLIDRLKHPEADIYIHLDAKASTEQFTEILASPQVYLIQNRIKVYWGSYSIVQATVNSFAEILAAKKDYHYINLLSGNDYPLKSAEAINQFFTHYADHIFMEYLTETSAWWQSIKTRVTRFHLTDYHFTGCYYVQTMMNAMLPLRTAPAGLTLVGRSQWLTVTSEAAQYVVDYLKENPKVKRFFRLSWGADEIAIQTILFNSPLKHKIVNNNYRYIDWNGQKDSPKTLTMNDADKLLKSGCLYARKFDMAKQPAIMDYLDTTF